MQACSWSWDWETLFINIPWGHWARAVQHIMGINKSLQYKEGSILVSSHDQMWSRLTRVYTVASKAWRRFEFCCREGSLAMNSSLRAPRLLSLPDGAEASASVTFASKLSTSAVAFVRSTTPCHSHHTQKTAHLGLQKCCDKHMLWRLKGLLATHAVHVIVLL